MDYLNIITESVDNIGIITLNRPKALNAINMGTIREIAEQAEIFDKDDEIKVIIIRGEEKAFAAGIDIKELLLNAQLPDMGIGEMQSHFNRFAGVKKPIIAAVSGYALGVGCELALACDIILASDNARFGQPELSLGIIPSFGGTQRLTNLIGKAKAMEMILSGRALTADEAQSAGLVSRIIPLPDLFDESLKTAKRIAAQPLSTLCLAKDAVKHAAGNISLQDGIDYENSCSKRCLASSEFRDSLKNFAAKHN